MRRSVTALGLMLALMAGGVGKAHALVLFPVPEPIAVNVNGVGDALIFPLFDTLNRDTLLAITNTSLTEDVLVHVRFHHGLTSDDVLDFNIGLSCGDVWTASVTQSPPSGSVLSAGTVQLTVNNPGTLDPEIPPPCTPAPQANTPIPLQLQNLIDFKAQVAEGLGLPIDNPAVIAFANSLSTPTFGYIEAFVVDSNPCDQPGPTFKEAISCIFPDSTPDTIMGHAFYLDLGTGRGEARNAVALGEFDAEQDFVPATDTTIPLIIFGGPADGFPDGEAASTFALLDPFRAGAVQEVFCVSTGVFLCGAGGVAQALAGEGGVDKELLMTRYNCDPEIGGSTQLVLTVPTGLWNISDEDFDGPDNALGTGDDVTPDPQTIVDITAFIFDEDENVNLSPRKLQLPVEVNMVDLCAKTISTLSTDLLGVTFPNLQSAQGPLVGGWLKLLNNGGSDSLAALPISRFGMTGMVFQSVENTTLQDNFNVGFEWHWIEQVGGLRLF